MRTMPFTAGKTQDPSRKRGGWRRKKRRVAVKAAASPQPKVIEAAYADGTTTHVISEAVGSPPRKALESIAEAANRDAAVLLDAVCLRLSSKPT